MIIRFKENNVVYESRGVQINLEPERERGGLKYKIPDLGEVFVSEKDIITMLEYLPSLKERIKKDDIS